VRDEIVRLASELADAVFAEFVGGLFILPEAQPAVAIPPEPQPSAVAQWQAENPGKELRPAERLMELIGLGDREGAEALAAAVVEELAGTADVGKVEWWFRARIEERWPPEEPAPQAFVHEPLEPSKALVPVPTRTWVADIDLTPEMSTDECIELMNMKHAVIGNYGGKAVVLSWERWNVNPRVLLPIFQNFEDFKHRYMNYYVKVLSYNKTMMVPAGEWWLKDPARGKAFDGVVLRPGQGQIVEGFRLNTWRGLAVVPKPGCWPKLLRHIYRVLGNGDRKAGRYILRWCAWAFQNPGKAAEAVLVLRGEEGAGKGMLARVLLKIFGAHGLPVSDPKHLVGAFSGHLQFCCFLFLDEAFWAGDSVHEGRLKALVTEETITIEPKYFSPFPIINMLHIMISSNSTWVVPAGQKARRYSVIEVSDARVGDFEYFDELAGELANGGIEAFLYDMLRLDLGGWHPKQIYKSAALREQKRQSLRGLDAWLEAILQEGRLPMPLNSKYPNRCLTEPLVKSAQRYDKFTNDTRVIDYLKRYMAVERFNIKSARGWIFPALAECRQRWETRFDGSWDWHDDIPEWAGPMPPILERTW
jgi:hypothetical protein